MKRPVLVGLAVVLAVVGVMLFAARDTDAAVRVRTTIGVSETAPGQQPEWFRISAPDLWPPGNFWMRCDDLTTTYSIYGRPTIWEGGWGFIGRTDARFLAYAAVAWPNRTF